MNVVITGRGALTAAGNTADATWQAVVDGAVKVDFIEDVWPGCKFGKLANFDKTLNLPDKKILKMISSQDILGIQAGLQAIIDSKILDFRATLAADTQKEFNLDTAVFVGSPGNKYFQQYDFLPLVAKAQDNMQVFAEHLFATVHPMWLLRILPNNVLAYIGIISGFLGVNHNIVNHAVSGMQALTEAYYAIKTGQAKRAIVVSYDMATELQSLYYYQKLGLISAGDLKPFDKTHDGTVLADGACALVLESEESASARAATIYGKIKAAHTNSDAQGLYNIDTEHKSLDDCLRQTLAGAALQSADVGAIIAHGNGNNKSDATEILSINNIFPHHPMVSAYKWCMGHTICPSGMLDVMLATYALEHKVLPGIATLKNPADLQLNISKNSRTLKHDNIMVISRGFAGMNSSVIVGG
jgi:3-oxoacyl-[acyl-carrier-protein] synthase I